MGLKDHIGIMTMKDVDYDRLYTECVLDEIKFLMKRFEPTDELMLEIIEIFGIKPHNMSFIPLQDLYAEIENPADNVRFISCSESLIQKFLLEKWRVQ